MNLRLCVVGLSVVLAGTAVAGEPPQKLKTPAKTAATAAQLPSVAGRKQLEALLQTPAKLDFGQRQRVTIREVLDRLHEQHHLSIRFDAPTLTAMLEATPKRSPVYAAPYTASSPGVASALMQLAAMGIARPVGCPPCSPAGCPPSSEGGYYPATSPPQYADAPAIATRGRELLAEGPAAFLDAPEIQGDRSVVPVSNQVPPAVSVPADDSEPASLPKARKKSRTKPTTVPTADEDPQVSARIKKMLTDELSETEKDQEHPPTTPKSEDAPATPAGPASIQDILDGLFKTEIDVQNLDLSRVSIATVLRHALDAAPTAKDDESSGMPILLSNATLLDYLVEDDGLLITSRMKALTTKETRVYSIKNLQDLPPEQLAKTIRQSIRPWSWRSQINDLGDQLKGAPLPSETLTSIFKTGVQLVGAEVEYNMTPTSPDEPSSEPKSLSESRKTTGADEARQMELLGNALTNGLVTLAQSTLLALEMVHYAEPPTGTIQTLGKKLIITQSQAAHREVAELLRQLAEE